MIRVNPEKEREVIPLDNFWKVASIEQQRYNVIVSSNQTGEVKSKKILRVMETLFEELLQCLEFEDAKHIVQEKFQEVYQYKIQILNFTERQDNVYFGELPVKSYFEASMVHRGAQGAPNQMKPQPEPVLSSSLVGQKRKQAERDDYSNVLERFAEDYMMEDLSDLELIKPRGRQMIENKEKEVEKIVLELEEGTLSQRFLVSDQKVEMGANNFPWTMTQDSAKNIYAVAGHSISVIPGNPDIFNYEYELDDSMKDKQYSSCLYLEEPFLVLSCTNTCHLYAFKVANPHSPFRKVIPTKDIAINLYPYDKKSLLVGEMEGWLEFKDVVDEGKNFSYQLSRKGDVNQISKTLRLQNEFALATSNGLYFVKVDTEGKKITESAAEKAFEDQMITSFFEFQVDNFVVNCSVGEYCLQVWNRQSKLLVKKVRSPLPDLKYMQLQALQNFNPVSFPYILVRDQENVILVDLKKGLPYVLLSNKPCNFVQFNKSFILNKFLVEKNQLSVMIFTYDKAKELTLLEEFQFGDNVVQALEILAKRD